MWKTIFLAQSGDKYELMGLLKSLKMKLNYLEVVLI